jgi:hypothetical protein
MDFKTPSGNAPEQHHQQQSSRPEPVHHQPPAREESSKGANAKGPIVGGIIALIVVVAAFAGLSWYTQNNTVAGSSSSSQSEVQEGKYQAVFLTNGQVYFGKVSGLGSDYIKLNNIYYLQVQQAVQPAKEDKDNSQVSLTKLGEELHGPTDEMHISKEQLLFWENLKDDSTVVKAIKQYESTKK